MSYIKKFALKVFAFAMVSPFKAISSRVFNYLSISNFNFYIAEKTDRYIRRKKIEPIS